MRVELRLSRAVVTIELAGQRKQTILALLLVNLGRAISLGRIVDAVWADASPPATAREQVQNCTAELRRALQRGYDMDGHGKAGSLAAVLTHPGGYRLVADPQTCDAIVFERVLTECLYAPSGQDLEMTRTLRQALDMWTGPALGALPASELQAEAARLDELRMLAVEELAARELRIGRMPALRAAELLALTRRHPYRERLWLLHMDALHRCGRCTEALERFREYRRMLVAEHGVEPGPEIRAKHQEILMHRS